MSELIFGVGTISGGIENKEMSWPKFCDFMQKTARRADIHPDMTEEEYDAAKLGQRGITLTSTTGRRRKKDLVERSFLIYDFDDRKTRDLRTLKTMLNASGFAYLLHTTTGDRLAIKGGLRRVRLVVPVSAPIKAKDIARYHDAFAALTGIDAIDADPCGRVITQPMFLPHRQAKFTVGEGEMVRRSDLRKQADAMGLEKETIRKELTQGDDAIMDGILDWCFNAGFEELGSGRGYEVPCPNEHLHSGGGSTAVMVKDGEIRFKCMHTNNGCCSELNRHQHLALRLLGMPDHINVEPHQLSKKQIAEMLPGLDDEEVITQYEHITDAVGDGEEFGTCSDMDLENEPTALFTKHDPIIEGLINFKSTWYAAGESNIGKSFYVLGQMAAVAAGIPFGGSKVVKSHCFYFDAEGGESSEQRKEALRIKYQDDLEWLHIVDLQKRGWDITSKTGRREAIGFINRTANGEPVGLVAFDSLNQTVALRGADQKPFDENNASDMGEIVKALKAIAENTGGTAGVIHHPAKSTGGQRTARGSGALHGAVDYAFFIEQPDDNQPGQLNLYHEKARNGVKQAPRGFVLLKCKVPVDEKKSAAFEAHQSANPGPDFGNEISGWEAKPISIAPRDETLYLVPVALAPFNIGQATKAGKDAVAKQDNPAGLKSEKEKLVYEALERLMDENPGNKGFSKRAILNEAGIASGGSSTKPITDLLDRKVFGFYKDPTTGVIMGSSNIVIPSGITVELVASDDDLSD